MKDLITEARELCEKATPGPWVSENMKLSRAIIGGTLELLNWASGKPFYTKQDFDFIARSRTLIPELCDALERAEAKIESIHKALDFAETQRQKTENYTMLAINNGLALGRIAVIVQHDFEPLPAPPEEGE